MLQSVLDILPFSIAGGALGALAVWSIVSERCRKLSRQISDQAYILENMRIQLAALHCQFYVMDENK